MIRSLRRRHRWMIALVAVAAGLLFVLALIVRPERAIQAELPAAMPTGPEAGVDEPEEAPELAVDEERER